MAILTAVGTVITWLIPGGIAFFGWTKVESFARERERRSDVRSLVEAFEVSVNSAATTAAEYYQTEPSDRRSSTLGRSVTAKLSFLRGYLQVFTAAQMTVTVDDQLTLFRQTLTGGDFETIAREPRGESDPKFAEIDGAAHDLTSAVQQAIYLRLVAPRA